MKLLQKAKEFIGSADHIERVTKDEWEVIKAYLDKEINGLQLAHALNCNPTQVTHQIGAFFRRAYRSGLVKLEIPSGAKNQ